jgi:hypothetical protein
MQQEIEKDNSLKKRVDEQIQTKKKLSQIFSKIYLLRKNKLLHQRKQE